MAVVLIVLPLLSGAAAFLLRDDAARRRLLLWTAWLHFLLTAGRILAYGRWGWAYSVAEGFRETPFWLPGAWEWFSFDAPGLLFLGVTSLLFLGAAHYAAAYLAEEKRDPGEKGENGFIFNNAPEAVFSGCLLFFLSAMTGVAAARHLGLLWAAVEATTLLSAPLIYFHRHKRSLEATWKYLLICSVGIALALMGNLFMGAAGLRGDAGLHLDGLLAGAEGLDSQLLKAAFIFLFVGYGTKMGLAPFHTWLPDAHSEAPAVVSALLSGALLNCAFLGVLRAAQVCGAAGLADFSGGILVLFGLASLVTAALFMLGQRDYKRMLAYSSIEHMGILAIGAGLGGRALYGALLGAVGHSLTKAGLFFASGLVLAAYRTKQIKDVKGLLRRSPAVAALWLAGFLLITGTPPSGIFLAKFVILKEAVADGRWAVAGVYLFFLAVVFAAMAKIFIETTFGEPAQEPERRFEPPRAMVRPALFFFVLVAALGLRVPSWLDAVLNLAAGAIGGAR